MTEWIQIDFSGMISFAVRSMALVNATAALSILSLLPNQFFIQSSSLVLKVSFHLAQSVFLRSHFFSYLTSSGISMAVAL